MAAKPIQSSDIVSPDAFTKLIKDTKDLIAYYKQLDKNVSSVARNLQAAARGLNSNNAADLQRAINAERQLTAAIVEQEKRERARIQTQRALLNLQRQQTAANERQRRQREESNNAYTRESKRLNELRKAYKNLAAQGRENGRVARALLQEITQLDQRLRTIDNTVGQNQRNVGNYTSALRNLGQNISSIGLRFVGFTALAYGLGRSISNSVGIFTNFEQESANLASVLGKTKSEIKALTEDAKRLGASTSFTASEVIKLQTAFSKLGFNQDEILNATEATLSLAAATGTDLQEAAEVSASTLNGFGMEADETQRVVDVMAKSFTTSALDMEKFKVAMRAVGPVAKTAGFSIEKTTAMLGVLADNGVRAETAGTGLRNVFLEISKRGITFEQAMSKIANSSDKAATSMELFGKENAVVGVVLSENQEKLVEMEKGLQNAGGSAEKMANTQLDTLSGATTRLSSAWEGFILSLEDGNGVISKVLRGAIELTTKLVEGFTNLTKSSTEITASRLKSNEDIGNNIALENQKKITELLQMSNEELKKEKQFGDLILTARKEGLSLTEQELLLNVSVFDNARKLKKELDAKNKSNNNALTNEVNARLQSLGLQLNTLELSEEVERRQLKGVALEQKAYIIQNLKKKSDEELNQILLNRDKILRQVGGVGLIKFTELELERRKDIKGVIEETIEGEETGFKNREKTLTGLEALQQKLNDLEKERSDLLVKNNGSLTDEFIKKTEQVEQLETKIENLKRTLSNRDVENLKRTLSNRDVGRVESREIGQLDTNTPEAQIVRLDDNGVNEVETNIQALIDLSKNFTDTTLFLTNQRIEALDLENEAQQRLYDESKTREQELIELRKAGAVNTEESLAFERQAQAEALKEQEKIAKKKQRLELINSSLAAFNSAVQNGNGDPLGKTIGDVTALVSYIKTLPFFWSGTDTTVGDALGSKISNGRDGILARVDKSEMILNKSKVDRLRGHGITTTEGILEVIEGRRFVATPSMSKPIIFDNSEVVAKLEKQEELLRKIASRPIETTDIEKLSNTIKLTQELMSENKKVKNVKYIRNNG